MPDARPPGHRYFKGRIFFKKLKKNSSKNHDYADDDMFVSEVKNTDFFLILQ